MQLCEPALKLDLSSLGARVSKLESRLASGDFAPARAAAKAEPQPESEDDDRPPFPDDADDPLQGLHRRLRSRRARQTPHRRPARRQSWTGAGRSLQQA